jgi:hypothetical protein
VWIHPVAHLWDLLFKTPPNRQVTIEGHAIAGAHTHLLKQPLAAFPKDVLRGRLQTMLR